MYRQFYANMSSVEAPLFAMGVFIFAFALVLLRTLIFKRRADFDPVAALPFQSETGTSASPVPGDHT